MESEKMERWSNYNTQSAFTFWISFILHWIDPKFHVDHEYLVYLVGSSMVVALSLTSGTLPENLHKTSKWALFSAQFQRLLASFSKQKWFFWLLFFTFVTILSRSVFDVSNRWREGILCCQFMWANGGSLSKSIFSYSYFLRKLQMNT